MNRCHIHESPKSKTELFVENFRLQKIHQSELENIIRSILVDSKNGLPIAIETEEIKKVRTAAKKSSAMLECLKEK